MDNKTLILDQSQIEQKIRRMAYEIFENNFKEKKVVLAGIEEQGYELAALLADQLRSVATFKVELMAVKLDKSALIQSEITIDGDEKELVNHCVILIDDVLNTGRTMAYSLKPFLNVKVKKLETAVLVNRSHTQFPISSQYVGYQLSTTINEHVEVQLEKDKKAVYLR